MLRIPVDYEGKYLVITEDNTVEYVFVATAFTVVES
jgi:hypothetical protein